MNNIYGVRAFFSPLALWLVVAIAVELVVLRKSHETNPWLPITFFIVTMFRLYWISWMLTLRIRDTTANFDTDTVREYMLISIFVFFVIAVFLPAMTMMFHHVWVQRERCGIARTLARFIPCVGVTYLLVSHASMAIQFIAKINPYA